MRSRIVDNTEALEKKRNENIRNNRKAMKELERAQKKKLEEMEERVNNRPLLMKDMDGKERLKRQKMQNLLKIKETAAESGVKNLNSLFTAEERELIKEAEEMQKEKKKTKNK